ncbi:hypothetical protein CFY87_05725 [Actinobacillus seminis]|uniref:Uncharacterized protein n=1 Tax=Actinobacillus seminis TaxID=722 RepID=A0ABX4FNA8_9PAST|nr:hypothetical protein CFY87_05725 [Actinobacillus seminis]
MKGFLKDQLRYVFMEEATPENIAPYLKNFVNNSRQYGQYTSLVIFEKPDKDTSFIANHITLNTESSVGNTLRFLMIRRITLFNDSTALVV